MWLWTFTFEDVISAKQKVLEHPHTQILDNQDCSPSPCISHCRQASLLPVKYRHIHWLYVWVCEPSSQSSPYGWDDSAVRTGFYLPAHTPTNAIGANSDTRQSKRDQRQPAIPLKVRGCARVHVHVRVCAWMCMREFKHFLVWSVITIVHRNEV